MAINNPWKWEYGKPNPASPVAITPPRQGPRESAFSFNTYTAAAEQAQLAAGNIPWAGEPDKGPAPNPFGSTMETTAEPPAWGQPVPQTAPQAPYQQGAPAAGGGAGGIGDPWAVLGGDIQRVEAAQQMAINVRQQGVNIIEQSLEMLGPRREAVMEIWDDLMDQVELLGSAGQEHYDEAIRLLQAGDERALDALGRSLEQRNMAEGRISGALDTYGEQAGTAQDMYSGAVQGAQAAGQAGLEGAQGRYDERLDQFNTGLDDMAEQYQSAEDTLEASMAKLEQAKAGRTADKEESLAQIDEDLLRIRAQMAQAEGDMGEEQERILAQNAAALEEQKSEMERSIEMEEEAIEAADQAVIRAQERMVEEKVQQEEERSQLDMARWQAATNMADDKVEAINAIKSQITKTIAAERGAAGRVLRRQYDDISKNYPNATAQELQTMMDQTKYDFLAEASGKMGQLALEGGKLIAGTITQIAALRTQADNAYAKVTAGQDAAQATSRSRLDLLADSADKLKVTALNDAGEGAFQRAMGRAATVQSFSATEAQMTAQKADLRKQLANTDGQLAYMEDTAKKSWSDAERLSGLDIADVSKMLATLNTQAASTMAGYSAAGMSALGAESGRLGQIEQGYAALMQQVQLAEARGMQDMALSEINAFFSGEAARQGWDDQLFKRENMAVDTAMRSSAGQAMIGQLEVSRKTAQVAAQEQAFRSQAEFNIAAEQIITGAKTVMGKLIATTPVLFYTAAEHATKMYAAAVAAQGAREARAGAAAAGDRQAGLEQQRINNAREDSARQASLMEQWMNNRTEPGGGPPTPTPTLPGQPGPADMGTVAQAGMDIASGAFGTGAFMGDGSDGSQWNDINVPGGAAGAPGAPWIDGPFGDSNFSAGEFDLMDAQDVLDKTGNKYPHTYGQWGGELPEGAFASPPGFDMSPYNTTPRPGLDSRNPSPAIVEGDSNFPTPSPAGGRPNIQNTGMPGVLGGVGRLASTAIAGSVPYPYAGLPEGPDFPSWNPGDTWLPNPQYDPAQDMGDGGGRQSREYWESKGIHTNSDDWVDGQWKQRSKPLTPAKRSTEIRKWNTKMNQWAKLTTAGLDKARVSKADLTLMNRTRNELQREMAKASFLQEYDQMTSGSVAALYQRLTMTIESMTSQYQREQNPGGTAWYQGSGITRSR